MSEYIWDVEVSPFSILNFRKVINEAQKDDKIILKDLSKDDLLDLYTAWSGWWGLSSQIMEIIKNVRQQQT